MSEAATGTGGATRSTGPLSGLVLSGRYRLESKLGSGGMSTVYLGRDETLERWVAVKVLHREISDQPDQIERFRREARSVAQLSHPNVVSVVDAGEDSGRPYIVFEYIQGETLKDRIDAMRRLPLDEACAYGIEIGRGLQAAHERRLVHRDVKPQNVLIDPEGRAKVTDFGIARSLENDGMTVTGRVLGTTDYVSPEQAMGQDVDARSDIYSLGILLFEMLVGEPPFQADTLVGVAMKHVNEELPDVQRARPDCSAALARVVERATTKDPKRRYPDMNAMLAELENALEVEVARAGHAGGEATSVLASVPGAKSRFVSARRISIAGVLLVLLGLGAALAIAALSGGDEESGGTGSGAGASSEPTAELTPVEIAATQDFDPEGDGVEHDEALEEPIDGDSSTYWLTETYTAGPNLSATGKSGVGLILDAEDDVEAQQIDIETDTPGFTAQIFGATEGPPESIGDWGQPIGQSQNVSQNQSIELDGTAARYYLIWIPVLAEDDSGGGVAHINEVTLGA
ncbi:serine/threonine protein kinase [Thermoleophilia bacterium SCSIO 60948]|nr:serine/threonine protein kinase [Thermoleophilia bacterium SCSIO 60948]